MNLQDIEFRTLDYSNDTEMRTYMHLFWDIPDLYYFRHVSGVSLDPA